MCVSWDRGQGGLEIEFASESSGGDPPPPDPTHRRQHGLEARATSWAFAVFCQPVPDRSGQQPANYVAGGHDHHPAIDHAMTSPRSGRRRKRRAATRTATSTTANEVNVRGVHSSARSADPKRPAARPGCEDGDDLGADETGEHGGNQPSRGAGGNGSPPHPPPPPPTPTNQAAKRGTTANTADKPDGRHEDTARPDLRPGPSLGVSGDGRRRLRRNAIHSGPRQRVGHGLHGVGQKRHRSRSGDDDDSGPSR